ncbi:MAG TPA: hypothetical protein VGQ55_12655, partial [Pyrinomonadaceae bacterium]|nr:hypothetical protein [Pyrinomonadaceae bacterium]
LPVADIYPGKLSDLFSAKPVILNGRYTKAASGTIRLKGKVAGQEYSREIKIDLPENEAANDTLASLWARRKIDQLTMQRGEQGANAGALTKEITGIGLEFRLLTENTSFVAVEERVVNQNGKPVKIEVPVAVPEGVDPTMVGAQETVDVTASGGGGLTITARQLKSLPNSGAVNTTSAMVSVTTRSERKSKRASGSGTGQGSGSGMGTGSGSGSGSSNGLGTGGGGGSGPFNATYSRKGDIDSDKKPEVKPKELSPEMIRDQKLKEKLHSWIYTLITRFRVSGYELTGDEAKFVRDGNATVRIEVSQRSQDLLNKLKAAGLEIVSEKENSIVGRIAVNKIASLAELDEVKLVLPQF